MGKVSKKDLERLIEGVVNEKQNIDISVTKSQSFDPAERARFGITKVKDFDASDKADARNKRNKLAAIGGKPTSIDNDDIAAVVHGDPKDKNIQTLQKVVDKWLKNTSNAYKDPAGIDGWPATLPKPSSAPDTPLKGTDTDTLLQPSNPSGIGVDDRGDLDPFGDVAPVGGVATDQAAIGVANYNPASIDSSLIAVVDSIRGDSLVEKLKTLETMNTLYSDPASLNNLTVNDTLKLAAATPLITKIAEVAKEFDSSAAGFVFEQVAAVLARGLQIGGSNGAADLLKSMKDGTVIRYSAKLLSNSGIKQAWAGKEGLQNTLNAGPVYYIFGFKDKEDIGTPASVQRFDKKTGSGQGVSRDYQTIKFFCVKINKHPDQKKHDGVGTTGSKTFTVEASIMDSTGEFVDKQDIIAAQEDGVNTNGDMTYKRGQLFVDKYKSKPFAQIKAVDASQIKSGAQAVAQRVNNAVTNSTNELLQNISSVYKLLQNLERNSQEYTAKQSDSNDPNDHIKYVEQIGKDYGDVRNKYESIFEKVDTTGQQKQVFKTKAATTTTTTESKITADYLKKLIEESFNK